MSGGWPRSKMKEEIFLRYYYFQCFCTKHGCFSFSFFLHARYFRRFFPNDNCTKWRIKWNVSKHLNLSLCTRNLQGKNDLVGEGHEGTFPALGGNAPLFEREGVSQNSQTGAIVVDIYKWRTETFAFSSSSYWGARWWSRRDFLGTCSSGWCSWGRGRARSLSFRSRPSSTCGWGSFPASWGSSPGTLASLSRGRWSPSGPGKRSIRRICCD